MTSKTSFMTFVLVAAVASGGRSAWAQAKSKAPIAAPAAIAPSTSRPPAAASGSQAPVPGAPAPAADASPKVKVERGAGGHKVYRITEEIRIEGKIQKPEAFFFYQKSSINYDWQELKQDFIPKILDSVSRAPF
jgi:hypothetical protein